MKTPLIFAIALSATFLTGCVKPTVPAGVTSDELCRQWGGSLPTRSHQDTPQTSLEIQEGYAVFTLACADWEHLVP